MSVATIPTKLSIYSQVSVRLFLKDTAQMILRLNDRDGILGSEFYFWGYHGCVNVGKSLEFLFVFFVRFKQFFGWC